MDEKDNGAAASAAIDESAESSPAEEKSLADVVNEAAKDVTGVDPSPEGESEADDDEEEKSEAEEEKPDDEEGPDEDDEDAATKDEVPKGPIPYERFKKVIDEKNNFKSETELLKPQAERAKALDAFCQTNGISTQELQSALEIAALLHVNPQAARDRIRVVYEGLELSLGDKLPEDLQRKVDDGTVDLDTAKEAAKARVLADRGRFQSQRSQEQLFQERSAAIAHSLNSWEATKRTTDPDYASKWDLVKDRFIALATAKPPISPNDAVVLAEQAYKEINQRVGKFIPRTAAKKALSSSGSSTKAKPTVELNDLRKDLRGIVEGVANGSIKVE